MCVYHYRISCGECGSITLMCPRPIGSSFSIARINYLAVKLNHKDNFCSVRYFRRRFIENKFKTRSVGSCKHLETS